MASTPLKLNLNQMWDDLIVYSSDGDDDQRKIKTHLKGPLVSGVSCFPTEPKGKFCKQLVSTDLNRAHKSFSLSAEWVNTLVRLRPLRCLRRRDAQSQRKHLQPNRRSTCRLSAELKKKKRSTLTKHDTWQRLKIMSEVNFQIMLEVTRSHSAGSRDVNHSTARDEDRPLLRFSGAEWADWSDWARVRTLLQLNLKSSKHNKKKKKQQCLKTGDMQHVHTPHGRFCL